MHNVAHLVVMTYLRIVTLLFAAGGLGCVAVLAMTFWEDLKTIVGS